MIPLYCYTTDYYYTTIIYYTAILLYYRCTEPTALNFYAAATADDASCIPRVPGCMAPAQLV